MHLSVAILTPPQSVVEELREDAFSSMTAILHPPRLLAVSFRTSLKISSRNSLSLKFNIQLRNMVSSNNPSLKAANDFLSFVNASPTRKKFLASRYLQYLKLADIFLAFHAVHSARQQLEQADFKLIKVLTPFFPAPPLLTLVCRNETLGTRPFNRAGNTSSLATAAPSSPSP